MAKLKIIIILVSVLLLLAFDGFAAQINSSSYKQNVIVSSGGENVSSSSYKMGIAISIINGIINSTSYINKLGFFHLLLLANDQPCTTASQCEGGFCCSNLCKSSACPGPGGEIQQGGGGGAAASGGGGGGGYLNATGREKPTQETKIKEFTISQNSLKEHLALDTALTRKITIKNTGNSALNFNLKVLTVKDFVFLSDTSFSLDAGQEKIVEANIIGKKLGSYFGEIEFSADGVEKRINVIIEVESEQVLFDVKIDIPSAYKEVKAGGELRTQITLLNVGPARKVDVTPTYILKDKLGSVIYESSETFAVEKQNSYIKTFRLPENLKIGEHIAVVELRYKNSFAVSSELFRVVPKEISVIQNVLKQNSLLMLTLITVAALIFLLAYVILPKIIIARK